MNSQKPKQKQPKNVNELKAKQIKFHSFHDFVSVCLLLEKIFRWS